LIVQPNAADSSQSRCYEASHFAGYKCLFNGIEAFSPSTKVVVSNSVMVDNLMGMTANMVPGPDGEYADHISEILDNTLYGNSISPDCPKILGPDGGFCFKKDKYGYTLGVGARAGKSQFLTKASPRPHMKIKADATWGGQNVLKRNKWIDYIGTTETGNKNVIFGLNFAASDHIPVTKFEDNEFKNIDPESFGYFFDPKPKWANVKDCGNFPCTAPWNVLLTFKGTKWTGRSPSFAKTTF